MTTRFFFPASTAAAVSPDFGSGVGGAWSATADALRRATVTTKGSSAIAIGTTINVASGSDALDRQYVSEPLEAQTISATATFSGQLMAREFAGTDNIDRMGLLVKIVSNDGTSETGCLIDLTYYGTQLEYINNATCRNVTYANGDTVTREVVCNAGDRLVIEIGHNCSGSGTTPQAAAKWGENATDLPVNDTQTTDGAGWFELSQTLNFQGGAAFSPLDPFGAAGIFGI